MTMTNPTGIVDGGVVVAVTGALAGRVALRVRKPLIKVLTSLVLLSIGCLLIYECSAKRSGVSGGPRHYCLLPC